MSFLRSWQSFTWSIIPLFMKPKIALYRNLKCPPQDPILHNSNPFDSSRVYFKIFPFAPRSHKRALPFCFSIKILSHFLSAHALPFSAHIFASCLHRANEPHQYVILLHLPSQNQIIPSMKFCARYFCISAAAAVEYSETVVITLSFLPSSSEKDTPLHSHLNTI